MVSAKVVLRTLRNVLMARPYLAHLCLTHQCNLKCYYCRAWQVTFDSLGLGHWMKIIDRLDQMGVAVISITGGEPLLHPDIFQIIEYANRKGLYVRLTTNGTMHQSRYDKLMDTNIDAISISLDDVQGDDLPNSKASPKILRTIRHMYEDRRSDRIRLSISMVLHEGNCDSVAHSLRTLQAQFPDLKVFVQPVVTGKGLFRHEEVQEVKMCRTLASYANVLDPEYYFAFCEKIQAEKRWTCQAGERFFDIKPDGQFYICQDFATELNILDEAFLSAWRAYDFSKIRSECAGCTYSCYVLTQEGFKPNALFSSARTWLRFHATCSRNA
jgi:MoaA/NifB/PqqE/SkfB family radical SAM enzyme